MIQKRSFKTLSYLDILRVDHCADFDFKKLLTDGAFPLDKFHIVLGQGKHSRNQEFMILIRCKELMFHAFAGGWYLSRSELVRSPLFSLSSMTGDTYLLPL